MSNDILSNIRERMSTLYGVEHCIEKNIELAADERRIPVIHIEHLRINVSDSKKGGDHNDNRCEAD